MVADGQYGADRTMAATYLEKGCDGGLVTACVLLGQLYLDGEWVEKNAQKALKLLTPGCVDGEIVHPKACKGIAMLYSEGSGVTRNRVEAARYLGVACEMGDLESCFLQGEQFSRFRGDERYDDVALMAFSKACSGGLSKACISSGRILEQGSLKLRDNDASAKAYGKACEDGLSIGCLSLGSLLERGGGTNPDFENAREAFKKAWTSDILRRNAVGECCGTDWAVNDNAAIPENCTKTLARKGYPRLVRGGDFNSQLVR